MLRGPGTDEGIVLHLQQVRYWRLVGFTVREGQKGVMADGITRHRRSRTSTVTQIGDEAVHLRTNSTDNVVRGLTISDTGLRRVKFGEGIYVGSAVSNWCDITDCEPDRSDRNVVVANTISRTAAESVDIKEGTTGGVLADNTFDGAGMRGDADSWVDVKGNGWLIQANHGTTAKRSGFEVNVQADGWGTGNTFDANTADVDGPGYGYELRAADRRPRRAQPRHLHQHRHRRRRGPHQHDLRLTDPGRPPRSSTSKTDHPSRRTDEHHHRLRAVHPHRREADRRRRRPRLPRRRARRRHGRTRPPGRRLRRRRRARSTR